MNRGQRWRFLEIGRRLERALSGIGALRGLCPPGVESAAVPWEALLAVSDASITYRRRYRATADPAAVLDLLLDDETNPRAVIYQLLQLDALLDGLGGAAAAERTAERAVLREALAELRRGTPAGGGRRLDRGLAESLERLQELLAGISDTLAVAYFSRGARPQQLVRVV